MRHHSDSILLHNVSDQLLQQLMSPRRGEQKEAQLTLLSVELVGLEAAAPCEDSSCQHPNRTRGGMRTNGGCKCDPIEIALAHFAKACAALDQPNAQRSYRRELQRRGVTNNK